MVLLEQKLEPMLREGGIALDTPVDLPRPRREHADPAAAYPTSLILQH